MVGAGAIHALLLHSAVLGLGYCVHVVLGNLLGPSGYGLYYYVLSWIGIIVVLCAFGLPNSVVKFVGQYRSQGQDDDLRGLIKWGLRSSAGLSVAGSVLWLTIILTVVDGPNQTVFLLATILIPLLTLTRVFRGLLRSFEFISWTYAPQITRHLGILAGCILLYYGLGAISSGQAMTITIIAVGSGLAISAAKFLMSSDLARGPVSRKDKKQWVQVSLPLMLLGGFSLLVNQTDILMIGLFSTTADVGVYQAASRTANLTGIVLITASVAVGPQIAHAFGAGDTRRLRRIVQAAARWIFWPSMAIGSVFILFSDSIVRLFGQGFSAAAPLLVILVVGHLFSAGAGVARELLSFTGYQKEAASILTVAVLVNIVGNAIGIYFLGNTGAAIATATTFLFLSVVFVYVSSRKLNIRPDLLSSSKRDER